MFEETAGDAVDIQEEESSSGFGNSNCSKRILLNCTHHNNCGSDF